jgi:hypothetical protein
MDGIQVDVNKASSFWPVNHKYPVVTNAINTDKKMHISDIFRITTPK